MKKLLTYFAVFTLLLGCLCTLQVPASAATEGDYTYEVADGNATITEYTGSDSDVTIPDTLGGYPVTAIDDGAFSWCESLTTVTIGNSVQTIGERAFYYCDSLTTVTIGDSVQTIGESAFFGCDSLTGIWVSENNLNYSSDESGVLFDKEKTLLIQAPGALSGSYTIPGSVQTISESAFNSCDSLTTVTIPDSVQTIGDYAFCFCNSLTTVTIGGGVQTIGSFAFDECDSLTAVTIPDSVQTIGEYAFERCGLTAIVIPDSVQTIGGEAFSNCTALESVQMGSGVSWIGAYAFRGCTKLNKVQISAENPYYSCDDRGVLFNKDKTELHEAIINLSGSYTVPDGVTTICSDAFADAILLEAVTIPDSVQTIGEGAFSYCYSLTTVGIGTGVKQIGSYAFLECPMIQGVYYAGTQEQWGQIEIGEENEDLTGAAISYGEPMPEKPLVPEIDAYYQYEIIDGKATITEASRGLMGAVVIPDTLGGCPVVAIGEDAFYGNRQLTSVVIPEGVEVIGVDAFAECYLLEAVSLPGTLKVIGEYAFFWTSQLRQITIPDSVTTIEEGAFYWSDLRSVVIPDSVTTICGFAFYGCHELTSVVLSKNITVLEEGVFYATMLEELVIPEGVTTVCSVLPGTLEAIYLPATLTTIEDMAFWETCLTDVYYAGSQEQWEQITIGEDNEDLSKATIHYNYVRTTPTGDVDGVEGVSVDDAIYLLQHVLMPELFPVEQSTDFNADGATNVDDAIYLLQHVLMPELFPLK